MQLIVRPWTVKQAVPFVEEHHRRLPEIQGAMWAVCVRRLGDVVGAALVGCPPRLLQEEFSTLLVLRVAVIDGYPNACSMLYGACARAARGQGAENLLTYTHLDEHGISLRAAGWVHGGETRGGEWDRENRQRSLAIDPLPKNRWWAPWSARVQEKGAPGVGKAER